MARKTVSFGQLLDYINAPPEKGAALLHNFGPTTESRSALEAELLDNSRYLPSRKNGNVLYHEILSFSDLDRARVTPAVLENLTRAYLSLRAPSALAYGRAHFNTSCPHVHLLISANDLGSSRRKRLSRAEFERIKRDLERYQHEHYPTLTHSLVHSRTEQPSRPRRKRREGERAHRHRAQGKQTLTRKEELRGLMLHALTKAVSGEQLLDLLAAEGIRLHCRGRTVTLEDGSQPSGRRYRLATLGIEEPFWKAVRQWEAIPDRLKSLEALEHDRARKRWAELGFREELLSVLQGAPASSPEREMQERLSLLALIEAERRSKSRAAPDR